MCRENSFEGNELPKAANELCDALQNLLTQERNLIPHREMEQFLSGLQTFQGKLGAVSSSLQLLISKVKAQSGKTIDQLTAQRLISNARKIIVLLGGQAGAKGTNLG